MIDAGHMHGLAILALRVAFAGGVLVMAMSALMIWRRERAKLRC